jgi:molybdate transport system ATP-binding protein
MLHLQVNLNRKEFQLDVDLQLPEQGITPYLVPQVQAKRCLLRAVAGLEKIQQGRIQVGTSIWLDTPQKICIPTWQRPLGYVFQESSLLPHLSVTENLNFGLKRAWEVCKQ